MRLLTYVAKKKGAAPRVGVMSGPEHLMEVKVADMLTLVAMGAKGRGLLQAALKQKPARALPLSAVRVLAPIPRPRKNVFCVGWNYVEHFEEGAKARTNVTELPKHPTFFTKSPLSVNGPYDRIPLHAGVTAKVDWEVELGVIVGRQVSTSSITSKV